tara:strand:- start:239 stop:571 length:333 start_codon:yes stop_codon:yes gene_type:complete
MSRLEMTLIGVLFFSVLFNVGLFLYARMAIVRLLTFSEELGDLQQMITSFANHVSDVYGLEMFYGDETLKSLMEHARSFREQIDTFEYIYSLTEQEVSENTPDEKEEKEE